jgi:transporter family-2 protein
MSLNVILLIGAFIAGILTAAQGMVNARLALHLGGSLNAAIVAFSVGLFALMLLSLVIGTQKPSIMMIANTPYWAWLGGLLAASS